ncbi:MAG: NTP transferase domain-containing protein [Chloroflexi bacterium]|nr:NTP transferase domain-containing protein [Chloroflexota bacterium]
MSGRTPKYSIVLAGGKGTRMRSADTHKVCFPIDGRPAINRALSVYKAAGIPHQIVVVGAMAGQVIETVGREHEGILFAYQAEQLGTAHATRQGVRVLDSLTDEADVLIVTGDRVVEPLVLQRLFDLFYGQHCDLAFLVGPKQRRSDPGHVVFSADGAVLGNVEARDIWQRQLYREVRETADAEHPLSRVELLQRIGAHFSDEKAALAFGDLWQAVAIEGRELTASDVEDLVPIEKTSFTFTTPSGVRVDLTPDQILETPYANYSIYLVRISALRYALSRLNRDNAQQEEYLSDLITVLAQAREEGRTRFRVRALRVKNPHDVMAFNDPAELLEIEAAIQAKKHQRAVLSMGAGLRPVSDWLAAFGHVLGDGATGDLMLWRELADSYGDDASLINERAGAYADVLEYAGALLGWDQPVLLVHSPGRVNVMGRHIDHQGGNCNLMTIGRETLMVVHPREDDQVRLWNRDRDRFPERQFCVGELVAELPWTDWLSLVNSQKVSEMAAREGGDWAQYAKAAVVRLQKQFPTRKLRGMDVVVSGNIPLAAGLSSSSALVVATAEAMVGINRLNTFPAQFVDLCGEGEWFVGTRGGSADHAAIKMGQMGKVVQVAFFDFAVQDSVSFPEDYVLAVCNSGIQAQKTAGARDQFNHRIACYCIGFKLIRKLYPQFAPLLHHLRDVNVRTLGVPLSWIYRILLRLPECATRDELQSLLPDDNLEPIFSMHALSEGDSYSVRGVVLFGLAEFERARLFVDVLKAGAIQGIGDLMNASHNGDRVAYLDPTGTMQPYDSQTSNGYLLDLIEDLESGDPTRVLRAQLQWQPGGYRCSVPEIDRMVDISLSVDGVVGAQLAGAGLGGCMMVLVHQSALPELTRTLTRQYYEPFNKPVSILPCRPVAGSGILFADTLAPRQ